MRVLVTGICGFLGRYLAAHLLKKRLKIYGTVHEIKHVKNIAHLKNAITLRRCDVRNPRMVKNVIEKSRPDFIFHLAAQSYPTISWEDPIGTMETNVLGTVNLFEAIRRLRINPKILIACSSAEYGLVREEETPIRENHPLLPLHPYGVSKVAQDLLAYQYFKNFGLNAVRARIFGTTGPGKVNDVCSDFAKQIAEIECKKREPIMYVGNLEPKRDLSDVRDMVNALWLLMKKGKIGEVYNVCSSKAYKIGHLLDKLLRMSDTRIKVEVDPKKFRPSDELLILGDNSKIKKDCGWRPTIPIEKTLKDILNYWRERFTAA
jgi:GDP-4-dehydro-6-deoxy-D-mannose reductase